MSTATQRTVSVFGALVGLAGIEHGVGEILQGEVSASGMMILSWPDSPFYAILSGEPAMTVFPTLRVTGILAVLFSGLYILWATLWVRHRRSGWVLILLSILMLLFGAGFGPPILGLIIAAAAFRIHKPILRSVTPKNEHRQHFAAAVWPWLFAAALITWIGTLIGVSSLDYFFGYSSVLLITALILGMFGFLLLTLIAAFWKDSVLLGAEHTQPYSEPDDLLP